MLGDFKKFLNVHDLIAIAVMSYLFIWLANKGLTALGLTSFTASANSQQASGS